MGFWSDPALIFQEDSAMPLNSIVDAHRSHCMPVRCDIDCNNWFAKATFGLCCNTGEFNLWPLNVTISAIVAPLLPKLVKAVVHRSWKGSGRSIPAHLPTLQTAFPQTFYW